MASIFGDEIRKIGFFKYKRFDFQGRSQIISRSLFGRVASRSIFEGVDYRSEALWDVI